MEGDACTFRGTLADERFNTIWGEVKRLCEPLSLSIENEEEAMRQLKVLTRLRPLVCIECVFSITEDDTMRVQFQISIKFI